MTSSRERWWGYHNLTTIDLDSITKGHLATPAGFDRAIHPYITPLDPQFGLPSGANQSLEF